MAPQARFGASRPRSSGCEYSHLLDLQGGAADLGRCGCWRPAPGPGTPTAAWPARSSSASSTTATRSTSRSPERYFEAAADLGVEPDGGPPEFFLNPAAEEKRRGLARLGPGSAPSGPWWRSRPEPRMPPSAGRSSTGSSWSRQIVNTGADVVALGGPEDSAIGAEIAARRRRPRRERGRGARACRRPAACSGAPRRSSRATPASCTWRPASARRWSRCSARRSRQFGFFPYHAHASVVERNLSCRPCSSHGSARVPARAPPLHARDHARHGLHDADAGERSRDRLGSGGHRAAGRLASAPRAGRAARASSRSGSRCG